MSTANTPVVNASIRRPEPSAAQHPQTTEDRAARMAWRRITWERWGVNVLALALAGLLSASAALHWLAVASTWAPTPSPRTTLFPMVDGHEPGPSALDDHGDWLCCREAR